MRSKKFSKEYNESLNISHKLIDEVKEASGQSVTLDARKNANGRYFVLGYIKWSRYEYRTVLLNLNSENPLEALCFKRSSYAFFNQKEKDGSGVTRVQRLLDSKYIGLIFNITNDDSMFKGSSCGTNSFEFENEYQDIFDRVIDASSILKKYLKDERCSTDMKEFLINTYYNLYYAIYNHISDTIMYNAKDLFGEKTLYLLSKIVQLMQVRMKSDMKHLSVEEFAQKWEKTHRKWEERIMKYREADQEKKARLEQKYEEEYKKEIDKRKEEILNEREM